MRVSSSSASFWLTSKNNLYPLIHINLLSFGIIFKGRLCFAALIIMFIIQLWTKHSSWSESGLRSLNVLILSHPTLNAVLHNRPFLCWTQKEFWEKWINCLGESFTEISSSSWSLRQTDLDPTCHPCRDRSPSFWTGSADWRRKPGDLTVQNQNATDRLQGDRMSETSWESRTNQRTPSNRMNCRGSQTAPSCGQMAAVQDFG